jgi:hypothetical protein
MTPRCLIGDREDSLQDPPPPQHKPIGRPENTKMPSNSVALSTFRLKKCLKNILFDKLHLQDIIIIHSVRNRCRLNIFFLYLFLVNQRFIFIIFSSVALHRG